MNRKILQPPNPFRLLLLPVAMITICMGNDSSFAQSTSRRPSPTEASKATSQPTAPTSESESVQSMPPTNPIRANPASNVRRDRSLESLSKLLELTESNLPSDDQAGSAFREKATDFKERNDARIESIHQRIFLIRKLIDKEKNEPTSRRRDEASRLPTESEMTEDSPANLKSNDSGSELTQPEENPVASSAASPTQSDSVTTEPQRPTETSVGKPPTNQVSDWGTKIATEPVDSFELASSLFMTGNYEGSKKTCEARLRSDIDPNQEAWLRCMIGCCERIMGEYTNAEASFRDVTNNRQDSYPVDYARWNLGYIRQRQEMQQQFENVSSTMDALIKEAKKP